MADIIKIDERTRILEDGFVRFFLLEGDEKAVLIDSGANCPNAADIAKELTDKPVMLLNTHGDGDHTSGTAGFAEIHMHPADYNDCGMKERYPGTVLNPISDGDIIDLGMRPLKMIHIPGHTGGSVAILDVNSRVLYAGDSVQKGHIYMFGDKRKPALYADSLQKLIDMKDEYDRICASHNECMLSSDYAEKVLDAWTEVQSGSVPFEMFELHGRQVRSYTTPSCGFYME